MVSDVLHVAHQQSPISSIFSWPLDQLVTDGILNLNDDMVLHPEEVRYRVPQSNYYSNYKFVGTHHLNVFIFTCILM